MAGNTAQDISSLSFEQALKELETIVRKLESGQGELEAAIGDYERGTMLQNHCHKKLADARMKVEKIIQGPDGKLSTAPLDGEK